MSQGKTCKRCHVMQAINDLIVEYTYFLAQMGHPLESPISTHARGFNHGRVQTVEAILEELKALTPYMTD